MGKKPTIRITYPEASSVAMKLTEAMIRRTPGKRTVETVAEDKDKRDEGYLLADLDAVKTSTSVELTLTLCPSAMDYALTQLIAKNLTEEERKDIYCNASGVELLAALPSLAIADGAREPEKKDSVPSLDKPGEKEPDYILREDITLTARLASLLAQIASTPKKVDIDRGFVPIVEDLIAYIDSIDTAGDMQPIVTMMLLKRLLFFASATLKKNPKNKRPDYYTLADELAQIVNNENREGSTKPGKGGGHR